MKQILFSIVLLFISFSVKSQEIFTKNRIFADIQTGLSNIGYTFGGGVHYGIFSVVSAGVNFNYQTIHPDIKYYTALVPEISVDYHFGKLTKTDWYVGASTGYCFYLSDNSYWKTHESGGCARYKEDIHFDSKHRRNLIYNAHLGVRYFIYKNFGLQAQLNAGNIFAAKLGVTIKM